MAGVIFIPFMKWPGWKQAAMITLAGFTMGPLHQGLMYVALTEISAGVASILIQSNVIMVTLIGWLFLKEQVGWRTWLGIAIGIIGIFVIFGGPSLDISTSGLIMIFLSAFFVALMYILQKKISDVHAPTYIALMSLPNALPILLGSYFIEGTDWITNIDTFNWGVIWGVVLYQAVILSLSHILWQRLVAKNDVSQIVPWTLLIPVVAVLASALFLGEVITIYTVLGGVMTIAGVGIITLRRIKKEY